MFKIVRFPKNLESFFDSLKNSFHRGPFQYFRTLVLLIVIARGVAVPQIFIRMG